MRVAPSGQGPAVAAVVFTDVVGSTARDQRLGPTRAGAARQLLFHDASAIVAGAGGRVVKSLGDGLLSVFPSPSAAVDAAVELQQLAELRGRGTADPVALRIGVALGEVTFDEGGDCFGLAVVEGARLCDVAGAGEILVSDVVRLLCTTSNHPFRSAGTRHLKGIDDPVATSIAEWRPAVEGGSFSMADIDADESLRAKAPGYLDRIGSADHMRRVRDRLLDLLDLEEGQVVLDVGSGTGDDAFELAALVGPSGRVVGVDSSESMVQEARRRGQAAGAPQVEFVHGDATALPLEDGEVDRVRSDRVFQYLLEPLRAMRELVRVARPGAIVVVADTDWETAVLDTADDDLTGRINGAWTATRPNGRVGHQLARFAKQAGLVDVAVEGFVQVKADLDDLYRDGVLPMLAQNAVAAEAVSSEEASRWLAMVEQAAADGHFLRAFTTFVVAGRVP